MNFLTAPFMYGLGAVVVVVGIFAGVQTVRLSSEKAAHATTKADHAKVLKDIADQSAEVARLAGIARTEYDEKVQADLVKHSEEISDAFERGKTAAGNINSGAVRVRTVWRDRECPKAAPGQGSEPAPGIADVAPGRGEAIGRVLGYGGAFDATYALVYKRLETAQGLVNACYEQPATLNP